MKGPFVAALFALVPFAAGCAGEIDARGAAYPEPVGYDDPNAFSATATAAAPAPAPAPQPAPQVAAQPPAPPPNANGDVEIGADPNAGQQYAETDPSALSDFRGALEPYGTWADDSTYGTVWTPSAGVVGSDFAPYVTAGHWAYDSDYVWVSDYSWGWAPFHYGRWVYIGGRGWSWIPGRVYSGAWVSWRVGYDDWGYVGWAPMPPTWYWYGGVAYGVAVVPTAAFVFCPNHALFHPHVGGQIVVGSQVGVVAGHTRPYTPATPAVAAGGRVAAHPSVGPTPQSLHIASNAVVRPSVRDAGIARAQAYAHPSTAVAMGGRPPVSVPHAVSPSPNGVHPGVRPSLPPSAAARPYAPPSHFPPAYGSRPYTPPYRSPSPSYSPRPYASPHYSPSPPPSYAPHYGPAPSYAPHYGPSPSYGGGYSTPYGHVGPMPGAHPGTAPAPQSSPRRGGSAPPAIHGGGGFRGGGRGGGRR